MRALIQYWDKAFSDYKVFEDENVVRFSVKDFLDPIMSPIFVKKPFEGGDFPYLNLLTTEPIPSAFNFDYGEIHFPFKTQSANLFEVVELNSIIENQDYWGLVQDAFPKDIPFLKRLLPFLTTLPSKHEVGLFYQDQKLVAAVTLGHIQGTGVILNTMVHTSMRQCGMTQKIFAHVCRMAESSSLEKVCFWTQSPFLLKFAHLKGKYNLIKNQQGEFL
jgi:hypothetical protein